MMPSKEEQERFDKIPLAIQILVMKHFEVTRDLTISMNKTEEIAAKVFNEAFEDV